MKKLFNFRPIVFGGVFLALGIASAVVGAKFGALVPAVLTAFTFIGFVVFATLTKKRSFAYYGAIFAAMFFLGFMLEYGIVRFSLKGDGVTTTASFSGEVESVTGSGGDGGYKVVIRNASGDDVDFGSAKIVLKTTVDGLARGDIVKGRASFYKSALSFEDIYRLANDITFVCEDKVELTLVSRSDRLSDLVSRYAAETIVSSVPDDQAGIITALVFGMTEYIDGETLSGYRLSGVAHIFAVSGLHIGFFYAIMSFFISKLRIKRWQNTVICTLLSLFYAIVCSSVSAYRAVVMCFIYGMSRSFGKKYDVINSIFISMAIVLAVFPSSLFGAGFILSYSAVISLALFTSGFKKLFGFLPEKLGEKFAASCAVVAGTLPAIAYFFGFASVLTVFLNVLLLPVVTVLYVISFFGVIALLIFGKVSVFLFVANAVAYGLNAFVSAIEHRRFVLSLNADKVLLSIYSIILLLTSRRLNLPEKMRKYLYIALPVTAALLV